MVKIISGNIFNSEADAIVNTVNCVGVMGKGLALNFKQRYPEMYKAYRRICNQHQLRPGMILPYTKSEKLILNFAVKDHWRNPSSFEWVAESLIRFVNNYERLGIKSAAFPWLGAGNGKLSKKRVREIMMRYLEPLPISIEIYDFDNSTSKLSIEGSCNRKLNPKSLNNWSYNSPEFVDKIDEVLKQVREKKMINMK